MRAVVQTVGRASVTVDDEVVGAIADGLLVLVGVTHDDTAQKAATLARKVHELRILDDETSAADWTNDVCSAFTDWQEAVAAAGESLRAGPTT